MNPAVDRTRLSRNRAARKSTHVRLTPEQYEGINAIADDENRTMGDVIREFVDGGLRRRRRR